MKRWIGTCAAAVLTALTAEAYDKAYEPTAPGLFEIKTLPAVRAMTTGRPGPYFGGENVAATTCELRAWLARQTKWVEDGPPRAAYWNGPFLPGFLKKYEVHIPVKPAGPGKEPKAKESLTPGK